MSEPKSKIDKYLEETRNRISRLSPDEAYQRTKAGSFLIDTRPQAYRDAEGSIPGAIVVERNVLEWRLDPTSPGSIDEARRADFTPIIVCNEGYASSLAAGVLIELGVTTATDLKGGFRAWKAKGLPVVLPSTGTSER